MITEIHSCVTLIRSEAQHNFVCEYNIFFLFDLWNWREPSWLLDQCAQLAYFLNKSWAWGWNTYWYNSTGWSKSHAPHIKTFVDGCNSVQFDWINIRTISLWLYKSPRRSHHVVTCSLQSVSCLRTVEVQRVFIVEHYLAYRSYLTCQNEFRDTFPDSPMPNKPTISRLVNRFRDAGTLHRVASGVNACTAERGGHFRRFV
jgi:hypothetical protein